MELFFSLLLLLFIGLFDTICRYVDELLYWSGRRMLLDEYLQGELSPNRLPPTWVSRTKFVFQSDDGNLAVYETTNNTVKTLVTNYTLVSSTSNKPNSDDCGINQPFLLSFESILLIVLFHFPVRVCGNWPFSASTKCERISVHGKSRFCAIQAWCEKCKLTTTADLNTEFQQINQFGTCSGPKITQVDNLFQVFDRNMHGLLIWWWI